MVINCQLLFCQHRGLPFYSVDSNFSLVWRKGAANKGFRRPPPPPLNSSKGARRLKSQRWTEEGGRLQGKTYLKIELSKMEINWTDRRKLATLVGAVYAISSR